ncbi:hypothetical protein C8R46DRAFT_1281040 [Mycena filopes]|nr:hypothetical protein C8R46DRAFT_1281040 [Mycena filopes]
MGQSWKVINLDKRVSFGVWGKLGQFLFGLPDGLAKSIGGSIPDRDTMLLPFRPGEVSEEGDEDYPPVRFSKPATQSTALLLSLPVELIHEVYLELELFADVMCFSVTCQTLWAIGGDHVYRHIIARATPYSWAGDRVLCVGEHLHNGHIPAGLLTSEEQDELLWDGLEVVTLFHYPFEQISSRGFQEYDVCQGDFRKRLGYGKERRILYKLCNFDSPEGLPLPTVVLRNLSQQQYVCESALLALKSKHAASGRALGRELAQVGLGEILMTRICLSSDPSASLAWDGAINRGVWAGDRFDTVDEEEFLRGAVDGAWKDVSGEVLKDLEAIWAAEFGF